jgi:hypothetical protein
LADPTLALPSRADFPEADGLIWGLEVQGLRAKMAARRLAERPNDPETLRLLMEVRRYDDALNVARVGVPGGQLLERGRWLIERAQWTEARAPLTKFLREHPKSPLSEEAAFLDHRARLELALDLADADKLPGDPEPAIKALRELSLDTPDFGVCAAKIALATLTSSGLHDECSTFFLVSDVLIEEREDVRNGRRRRCIVVRAVVGLDDHLDTVLLQWAGTAYCSTKLFNRPRASSHCAEIV